MPVLMLLMGAATLALVASNSYAKTPKRAASPYNLDPHIEPSLRAQVEAALNTDMDPTRLEAFARALDGRYPYAAWYLRSKSEGLRRMGYGGAAALPQPQPVPSGGAESLDAGLPENLRFNIIELLSQGSDPAAIEAFAAQLSAFPRARAALRLRAAFLRSMAPPAAALTGPSTAPAAAPAAAPAPAPAIPVLPGFDANIAPEKAMEIAQVLMTENDPAKLRGYAAQIQALYPLAAAMLSAKANAIFPTPAPGALSLPAVTPAATPASSAPSAPPAPPPPIPMPSASASPFPAAAPVLIPPASVEVPGSVSPPATPPNTPAVPQLPIQIPGLFDAGMTPEDQARVTAALTNESDPARLRALADSIANRFPNAAQLLTAKAATLSVLVMPGSAGSTPPFVPAVFTPPPQASPPAPAQPAPSTARTYKVERGDFPIRIAKKFGQPEIGWKELVAANPQKPRKEDGNFRQLLPGERLVIPASWPDRPGVSVGPAQPAPTPTSVPVPIPPPPAVAVVPPGAAALDPGIEAQTAQAVLTALATENDPAALRGFASSIMAKYPIASGVLMAKAATIGTFGNVLLPAKPGAAPPIVHLPTGSPVPLSGARAYRVVNGDSPSRIAKKLTGNDAKWPELVAANPGKPKKADGNFQSLRPGEMLTIPVTWPAVTPNGAPANAVRA